MRKMGAVILCLSASVLLLVGSGARAEPTDHSEIYFSVPWDSTTDGGEQTPCLTNPFKPGLGVVLLGKVGVCRATTADQFTILGYDFEPTRLAGTDECFGIKDKKRLVKDFIVAVVAVDPAMVNLVSLKHDKSPVANEIELRARKIVPKIESSRRLSDLTEIPVILSDAKPKVFRTDEVTLLIFDLQMQEDATQAGQGPMAALINGEVFLLKGESTHDEPIFFSANGKLHVAYSTAVGGWENPHPTFLVYDLSSGRPEIVYAKCPF